MTRAQKLRRLAELARMHRDRDLAELAALSAAVERDKARLAALSAATEMPAAPDPALFRAAQLHARWAMAQRGLVNIELAAKTAQWLACRQRAAQSFGRALALERLRDKA